MKWKTKAKIQKAVSLLPTKLSYSTYYWLQTKFGKLESSDPLIKFKKAALIGKKIKEHNKEINEKTFFELGTGFRLNVPIAFWLMGAKETITVDLNPYLKWDLISNDLQFIKDNPEEIRRIIPSDLLIEDRFKLLINNNKINNLKELKDLCNISYLAPSDASKSELDDNSIDYHISNDVLEHIPPSVIKAIFKEGKRIITSQGLFIHMVDFTDHFSHSDKSISSINFLKYTDKEWKIFADNKYMYMNRLRVDDIEEILKQEKHQILSLEKEADDNIIKLITGNEITLDERFKDKNIQDLAVLRAWFVTAA